ncbi:MAG: hypothetical protein EAZ57_06130 [Cytophagales bacterium]|nr:MAG: hypothetical protein EAZ67_08320 [Cytophagales bacterium]TAF60759.1 MAG: hypothetical protein EAZ57_06130 [Cytophagales bacterium]
MFKKSTIHRIASLFLTLLMVWSCQKDQTEPTPRMIGKVIIKIEHYVGNQPLKLGDTRYQNALNQPFNVEKFNYYLSNFRLRNLSTGLSFSENESFHLLRVDEKSHVLSFEIDSLPLGTFSEFEFAIGIDNAHNTSIDRDGDLDPTNNMAWDWNTGYKFIVLEGQHFTNTSEGEPLIFHIGEDKNYKTLKYRLSTTQELRSEAEKTRIITLKCQVEEMFTTPTDIDFKNISKVSGGQPASDVATNYAQGSLFQIKSIE